MGHFKPDTKGTDVVDAFAKHVKHKTFILSGITKDDVASSTARALAHGDAAALILLGPSQPDTQPLIDELNRGHPKVKLIFVAADMGDLASVRAAATTLRQLQVPIDGVVGQPTVFGAGASPAGASPAGASAVPATTMAAAPAETKTADGIDTHFQHNYLAHFLLVNMLLGSSCLADEHARVVLVASSVRPDASVESFNNERYHPLDAYAQSVFANVLFAKKLAKLGARRSVTAFAVNPGNITTSVQTYLSADQVASWLQKKKEEGQDLPLLLQQAPRSLSQGSATVLQALLDPSLSSKSGAFLDSCHVQPLPNIDFPAGEPGADALWARSEQLVGEQFQWCGAA